MKIFRNPYRYSNTTKDISNKLVKDVTDSDDLKRGISNNQNLSISNKSLAEKKQPEEMSNDLIRKIEVCVRKKPTTMYDKDVVDMKNGKVIVQELKKKLDLSQYIEEHEFHFNHTFDEYTRNEDIFDKLKNIVNHVVSGGNGTMIAYGQTGTGKTHTMYHPSNGLVFQSINEWLKFRTSGYISFIEIYNSTVFDLLDFREKIELREKENSLYFSSLTEVEFKSLAEGIKIVNSGLICRKKGTTSTNNESSRSHAILRISSKKNEFTNDGNCLVLVDLAGSERGSDRLGTNKLTRNEGAEINKSLLALKECIRNLEKNCSYQPFRQSKLTQILKSSLIGMSQTVLIATISPAKESVEYTLNTLRYASKFNVPNKNKKLLNNEVVRRDEIVSLPTVTAYNQKYDFKDIKFQGNCKFGKRFFLGSSEPIQQFHGFNFDSNFCQKNIRTNEESFYSDRNLNENNQINLSRKRIEKIAQSIIKETENTLDVKLLKKTAGFLKLIEKEIFNMKFS
ncbi:hypothetical protein EDEG_01017 [Edhazardia aedis USNM 41457]|uniref:Kinesin motor domain-containing protein n=1 Tax=Edhazardia aedis (strain USNM 41457) TaxID=1003232 RepID=J9DQF7_EDHAE|nr:hypothetical protein EDEG_01017 [Edhazardia aedis USNM 41457]|eukprot:EJW04795.1 hypothetical protein EDEG_01017 [Edhazardia aedis USNM 41457]